MSMDNLYTTKEIMKMFPQLSFTPQDLSKLIRNDLVIGVITKKDTLINLDSYRELVDYRNKILEKKKS